MITLGHQDARMSDFIPAHLDHLRAGGKSPRTIEARGEVLQRLHTHLPFGLAYAATDQLEAWLAQPGWSRWTRATYANHIRAFYRWATQCQILDGDPACAMARPKTPRLIPNPATEEELSRALRSDDPWFVAVVLAAFAGLRADEIAHTRREHINPDKVFIPSGKGGDPGTVPTHPYLWTVVKDRPHGLLVTNHGSEIDGRWISANARHHFDHLGLPDLRMHRLRHRFGTLIQATYGDMRITQECLRHASPTSTAGYTLVTGERRTAAVAALPVPVEHRAVSSSPVPTEA